MTTIALRDLYEATSKHSNYQTLAPDVDRLLGVAPVPAKSRYERERFDFISRHVAFDGLHAADIGGNTGFFSFEMLRAGATRVDYFEGNVAHHDFVHEAARQLALEARLATHARYVEFTTSDLPAVDCTLLLNVLHHLGDDYGDHSLSLDAAKASMLAPLATIARTSRTLVFQLGFNWRGDRHRPLFANGTKAELIEFVRRSSEADWDIDAIGIAVRDGEQITFRPLDEQNVQRDDRLGEFLNRPLFIMRSRHLSTSASGAEAAR
jgi:hypothetical protein